MAPREGRKQRLEGVAGTGSVEHVAGAHREIVGQAARPLAADAGEFDFVNPSFVDGERQGAGRLVERAGDLGERETLVPVVVFDLVGNLIGRGRQRFADAQPPGAPGSTRGRAPERRRGRRRVNETGGWGWLS